MLVVQKLGMTRMWWEGVSTPVTVLRVLPQWVLDLRTPQRDGRWARRTVWGFVKAKRAKRPLVGELARAFGEEIKLFAEALRRGQEPPAEVTQALEPKLGRWMERMLARRVIPGRGIFDVPLEGEPQLEPGQELRMEDVFEGLATDQEKVLLPPGAVFVDVVGRTKGRGFAGVMKRWGFGGGPASHGSKFHRRPGSIGQHTEPAKIWKGKKMAGHYGDERVTVLGLALVGAIPASSLLLVKGAVPGSRGGVLFVRPSVRRKPNA